MTTANSTIFNPTDLVLELDQSTIARAWSQSQKASTASSRWQNYLNQVALAVFLPWLQAEEDATAQSQGQQSDLEAVWEVVNGTAIAIKDAKLVLIPSEADDLGELRVPQEWIDIPSWSADYYLAVQVNVDDGYVRIWGYATHQQLKQGSFNSGDRTYSLTDDELISDLNALWIARALCPDEVTQATIDPLVEPAPAQADKLIERLGNPAQPLPRLAVSFATWGALLQNPQWFRRLAATRHGIAPRTPVIQWLKQGVSDLASEFGWRQLEVALSTEGAKGTATSDAVVPAVGLAKQLAIANHTYELRILPLQEQGTWRFELCCLTPGCLIPAGFKLKLLTAAGQDFEDNEDIATEAVPQLALEVDLDPGESLIWQIEPTPDHYQPEILQF